MNASQVEASWLEIVGVVVIPVLAMIVVGIISRARSETAPLAPASRTTESFGANIALGAGLVSGLFTVTGLPQPTFYVNRPIYGVMILLFAAIVASAAPVANLLIRAKRAALALFAAGALVLWGASGQLVIAFCLILELQRASVIANMTAWILEVLDVIFGVGVLGYVAYAVYSPEKQVGSKRLTALGPSAAAQNWIIP